MPSKTHSPAKVIIGTAGHVDHGKTTLVKSLTGMDTDRLAEEKKRGLTIDLGFAYVDLPGGVRAAVIDVPGHERFIKNMLAGVTGIDMVLFCVAADDGVMPQTREHLEIVNLLGIRNGLFVITKADLVDARRLGEVRREVTALLKGTGLEGSCIVEASATTGSGMEEVRELLAGLCRKAPQRDSSGLMRLPVDRSFTMRGFGTVVTGTVASGALRRSDTVLLYPHRRRLRVRGIESHHLSVESVSRGQRAAVNLAGISCTEVKRGDMLVSGEVAALKEGAGRLDCVLDLLSSMPRPLKNRRLLKLHYLTSEVLATVLLRDLREAAPGSRVYARIRLNEPLMMFRGDRFILRDPSVNRTIAGGEVLLPYYSRGLAPAVRDTDFECLEGGGAGEVISTLLSRGGYGVERDTLCIMLNMDCAELDDFLAEEGRFTLVGGRVVKASSVRAVRDAVLSTLSVHHREHPGEVGMKVDELLDRVLGVVKGRVGRAAASGLFRDGVLDELIREGRLRREGAFVALAGHRPEAAGAEKEIEDAILRAMGEGFTATRSEDIERLCKGGADAKRVLQNLLRRGLVVRLRQDVFISAAALRTARERLERRISEKGPIRAAEFRDILGCGRRLAIDILEYFDKERVTIRKGDVRILR